MSELRHVVVVDTGAFLEASDASRPHHQAVLRAMEREWRFLLVPSLCVGEAAHLIKVALGNEAEARFVESLTDLAVVTPSGGDWARVAEIMRTYSDSSLGAVDASIVAMAEQLNTDLIMTLDHRHFRAIRPRHCEFFRLLPEL